MQRNIVSARSHGNPKLNDVAVNEKSLGVTVQPCKMHKDQQKDDQSVTWKQISRRKSPRASSFASSYNFPRELQLLDLDRQHDEEREIDTVVSENRTAKDSPITRNESDDELKVYELDNSNRIIPRWEYSDNIQILNRTYSIRDSEDIKQSEIFQSRWRPIECSPRVEFYFKDTVRTEVREVGMKKSKRSTRANNEEIRVAEHMIEDLKMNDESKEDNLGINKQHDKAKVSGCRTEEIRPGSENERDIRKTNDAVAADSDELCANKTYERDKRIMTDEDTEAKEIFQEIKDPLSSISQNLSDSHEHKSSALDVVYLATLEAPVGYQRSSSRELNTDSTDNNDFSSNVRFFHSKHENPTLRSDDKSDVTFPSSLIDQNQNYNTCSENEMSRCKSDRCCSEAERHFDLGDFENKKKGETDYDVDVDGNLNIRAKILGRSINEAEVAVGESSRQVYDKRVISDVDYGSNVVTEDNTRGDNDSGSLVILKDDVVAEGSRYRREKIASDASVNLTRCVPSSSRGSARECPRDSVEMKDEIRGNMNLLRDSTDSLISSAEYVELASIAQQPKASCAREREIIKIIRPGRRSRMLAILPDIAGEPVETRENGERSANRTYWERASKISRSRLISLDPARHVGHKLAKRNPRVRILPPVQSSPSIQRRYRDIGRAENGRKERERSR